jgi:hypothetical protein
MPWAMASASLLYFIQQGKRGPREKALLCFKKKKRYFCFSLLLFCALLRKRAVYTTIKKRSIGRSTTMSFSNLCRTNTTGYTTTPGYLLSLYGVLIVYWVMVLRTYLSGLVDTIRTRCRLGARSLALLAKL